MKTLILLMLTITTLTVSGQELYNCDTTKSFWAFSQDSSFFSIKVLGNARLTERKNVISIDNFTLQSLIVDKVNFVKEGEDNADLSVLRRYAMSEADYFSGLFKTKINIRLQQAPLSAKKNVLLWFFEMPPGHNQEVKSQVFANIVMDNKIVGLARPQFLDQKFESVRNSLMDAISTLRKSAVKNDFDNLCGN